MEINCLVLFVSVFGVTIYGASGKPVKPNDWIENFTSDDVLGNWSLLAIAMQNDFGIPGVQISGGCVNLTVSRQDSEPLLTVHLLVTYLLEIDGDLPKTILNSTLQSGFYKENFLLVAKDYFLSKNRLERSNGFASGIFIREGYTPTTSVFSGMLEALQNLGKPVTNVRQMCTTGEPFDI